MVLLCALVTIYASAHPQSTTRGFKEAESEQLANWICDVLDDIENTNIQAEVKQKVLDLCDRLPVYI